MKIEIRTSNAAFCGPDGEPDELFKAEEIARILEGLVDKLRGAGRTPQRGERWPLFDLNGNKVGQVRP